MKTALFIKSLPFFQGLSDEDTELLVKTAEVRTYTKKSSIFMHGDHANCFYVIISGWVKLHQTTMEGEEAVLALFTRGDGFGEAVLVKESSYPHNAEAIEETKLIELPAKTLKKMVLKNPKFSLRLMQTMSNNIHQLQLESEHLSVMTTRQRVACFLLRMCLSMERYNGHMTFPYDKHLAAARLGMKPETFSRALKDLKKEGVNVVKNNVYTKDLQKIKKLCCSHCSSSPEECVRAKEPLFQSEEQKRA